MAFVQIAIPSPRTIGPLALPSLGLSVKGIATYSPDSSLQLYEANYHGEYLNNLPFKVVAKETVNSQRMMSIHVNNINGS